MRCGEAASGPADDCEARKNSGEDSKRRSMRDLFLSNREKTLRILRIGTRGSMLAKWQAESVRKNCFGSGMEAEIVIIKTSGDKMQQAPRRRWRQGMFIKELEEGPAGGVHTILQCTA